MIDPVTRLYASGVLVINDRTPADRVNGAEVLAEYPALTDEHPYIFASGDDQPWFNERNEIYMVRFGSAVKPTSCAFWFQRCALTEIDFTNFDGSEVTTMRTMFEGCQNLEDVLNIPELPALQTARLMFSACSAITDIDLSGINAVSLTETLDMFKGCASLLRVDISGIKSSVQTCDRMFANSGASAPDMVLETITATSAADFSGATSSANMFRGCTSLVGGAGTVFDSTKIDKAYARLDGGSASPGYFTRQNSENLYLGASPLRISSPNNNVEVCDLVDGHNTYEIIPHGRGGSVELFFVNSKGQTITTGVYDPIIFTITEGETVTLVNLPTSGVTFNALRQNGKLYFNFGDTNDPAYFDYADIYSPEVFAV